MGHICPTGRSRDKTRHSDGYKARFRGDKRCPYGYAVGR